MMVDPLNMLWYREWEKNLATLQDIMDEWLKVQATWLYLEPIFSSPDIMAQMPQEGHRFTTVDKNWRDIMQQAEASRCVMDVLSINKILDKLHNSNELLELIQKVEYFHWFDIVLGISRKWPHLCDSCHVLWVNSCVIMLLCERVCEWYVNHILAYCFTNVCYFKSDLSQLPDDHAFSLAELPLVRLVINCCYGNTSHL